jgi:glycosyltransferase involved in cell wall biosynthesis
MEDLKQSSHAAEGNTPRMVLVYWGSRGGGSTTTLGLATCLTNELGYGSVILSLRNGNAELDQFYAAGFQPLLISLPPRWCLPLCVPFLLRDLVSHAATIAKLKPTMVLFTMNFPLAWPFVHILQRHGIRVGYVAHDAQPHPGDYAQIWQRVTQNLLLRFANRIITLSDYVAQALAATNPSYPSRLRTLEHESFLPLRTEAARIAPSYPIRLLFLGRLIRYKGIDVLAQALTPLRGRKDWTLTIAGDGPLASDVRTTFDQWPQVTTELGWLPRERFDALMRAHDVLLCPYTEASQSGVVGEALTFALPCLVMPSGALPSQVGHGRGGLVADEVTAQGFSRLVGRVLDSPALLADLSKGALDLIRERRSRALWPIISD